MCLLLELTNSGVAKAVYISYDGVGAAVTYISMLSRNKLVGSKD